jgi:hypothetical protein
LLEIILLRNSLVAFGFGNEILPQKRTFDPALDKSSTSLYEHSTLGQKTYFQL